MSRPEWDRILSASQKNNDSEIHRLVTEEHVPASHANAVGQSALHIAALWGNVEALKALLSHLTLLPSSFKNINAKNRITGATPLHCTIQSSKQPFQNRVTCAKLLIESGADVSIADKFGAVPLEYLNDDENSAHFKSGGGALLNDEEKEFAREMKLIMFSSVPRAAWVECMEKGDIPGVLDAVQKEGVNDREKEFGLTPLLYAVDRLLSLLDKNDEEIDSSAALLLLSATDVVFLIQKLLEMGANPVVVPQRSNDNNRVPERHYDTQLDQVTTTKKQSDKDDYSKVDANMDATLTPIHRICVALSSAYLAAASTKNACKMSHYLEQVALMFYQHCPPHVTLLPYDTRLILHDAARRNNLEMVTFLIEKLHVDPNTKGRQGLTALHFAARSGRLDVVSYLLSLCRDDDDENNDNNDSTAIMKVDIMAVDDRGKTALDAAIVNSKSDVVHLIEQAIIAAASDENERQSLAAHDGD